ncbi:MAG: pantoate--beta-alanine ligase [Rikenellaceae bacterium]
MKIVNSVAELRAFLDNFDQSQVGFVPTMGAIHEGHLSLVRRAKEACGVVAVSIFVNPTQFNDPKDLERYPRQLQSDCELLEGVGADVVFAPSVEEIYPEVDTRVFEFGTVDAGMEGASRPGHFNGVAQVVSRLFDIVLPAKSFFGEKDFQQVAVIKAMVAQLQLPVDIVVVDTVRESDGLALSSRNVLLTPEHRASAPHIYKALQWAKASAGGGVGVSDVCSGVIERVEASGLLKVLYFAVVDASSMVELVDWSDSENIQGCIAVQAGAVRLIDNIKLK